MSKSLGRFFLPPVTLDRALALPLYRQLCEAIRQAILRGSLRKGLRLPSTRHPATELCVSRNIVVMAFEQLTAEGYIESKTSAGTFVTNTLPEEVLQVQDSPPKGKRLPSRRGRAMKRVPHFDGRFCCAIPASDPKLRYAAFRYGLPALDELPLDLWGRLLARHCRTAPAEVAVDGHPGGLLSLREAIASYVGAARGPNR